MQGSRKGRKERTGGMGWAPMAGRGSSAPHPGQPGRPGPGWPPASPGGSADGGWGAAAPGGTPPPALRRRGHTLTAAAVAAVAAVAAATGFGIGHEVWPTRSPVMTASQGGTALPNNTGSGNAQNPGSSSSGQSPFGSGDGSGSPFGQSPFGSGGSSGSSSGQSPFGSGDGSGSPFGQSPFGSGGTSGDSPGGSGTEGSGTEGSGGPSDVGSIAAKVAPALVDVNSTFGYQGAQGAGTGVVLSSTGEILTNNHVIDGATKISVTDVGNGKTYDATVVGYDASHDVAVLQLHGASGLQTAKLGDSAAAAVGDPVVAIGNAGGTGGTPTSAGGSITALGQSITASDELGGTSEQLSGLIQVNANVQAGDSGGSLVNSAGQVIGIDTSRFRGAVLAIIGEPGLRHPDQPGAHHRTADRVGPWLCHGPRRLRRLPRCADLALGWPNRFRQLLRRRFGDRRWTGYLGRGRQRCHQRWRCPAGRCRRRGCDHLPQRPDRRLHRGPEHAHGRRTPRRPGHAWLDRHLRAVPHRHHRPRRGPTRLTAGRTCTCLVLAVKSPGRGTTMALSHQESARCGGTVIAVGSVRVGSSAGSATIPSCGLGVGARRSRKEGRPRPAVRLRYGPRSWQ